MIPRSCGLLGKDRKNHTRNHKMKPRPEVKQHKPPRGQSRAIFEGKLRFPRSFAVRVSNRHRKSQIRRDLLRMRSLRLHSLQLAWPQSERARRLPDWVQAYELDPGPRQSSAMRAQTSASKPRDARSVLDLPRIVIPSPKLISPENAPLAVNIVQGVDILWDCSRLKSAPFSQSPTGQPAMIGYTL
jgi:hypothetical protein